MLKININDNSSKEEIPDIKCGDIITFECEHDSQIALVYKETKNGGLKIVSLNNICLVWGQVEDWWNNGSNMFKNIKVMKPGTKLTFDIF